MLGNKEKTLILYFCMIGAFLYFYPQYLNIKETTNGISNYIILLLLILIFSTLSYLIYFFYSHLSFKK